MTQPIYSMSFTSGTLLYHESLTIAQLHVTLEDWETVRDKVVAENRLQMRTLNASRRICREVISRLKLLTQTELGILVKGSRPEQNYLLWLVVCKRYRFIYDFAVQVVREKFLRFDLELSPEEYDIFFNTQAEWHPEVERVALATRSKQRQVVFKMLREAEILSAQNHIIPTMLTPRLMEAIGRDDPAHLAIFPISDADVIRGAKS